MDKKILRTDLDLMKKMQEVQLRDDVTKDDIPGFVTDHPEEYVFCPANEHFKYARSSGTIEMLFSAITRHRDSLSNLLQQVREVTEEAVKESTTLRPKLMAELVEENKNVRGGKGLIP